MIYRVVILNKKLEQIDSDLISATGKRLAINKYLRKKMPRSTRFNIIVQTENMENNYYVVDKMFNEQKKMFIKISKVKGFKNG